MELNLKIKDFQSLKEAELTIPDGVTIITGSTNQGKSAIIRAIDTMIFNLGDDSKIRSGTEQAMITMANSKHSITFIRNLKNKAEKTVYIFDNGTPQSKVGRAQLKETVERFNIQEIKMQNNIKAKLNFWFQNDKPFLMDKTPAQLYEFLSLTSCNRYSKILKIMEQDIKAQNAEINETSITIDLLKRQQLQKEQILETNKNFGPLLTLISKKNELEEKLQLAKTKAEHIAQTLEAIRNAQAEAKTVNNCLQTTSIKKLSTMINNIESKELQLAAVCKIITSIKTSYEKLNKTKAVLNLLEQHQLAQQKTSADFKNEIEVLDINQKTSLKSFTLIQALSQNFIEHQMLQTRLKQIIALPHIFTRQKMEELETKNTHIITTYQVLQKIVQLGKAYKQKQEELKNINTNIKEHNKTFDSLKQETGFCPYCGTSFNEHKEA